MFWRGIGRIIGVTLAFFVAAAAALAVLVTLGLERITTALHRMGPDQDAVAASFDLFGQGLVLATGLSIIPALLVVFVGEIARIRSAVYYVAGGGAALAALPLLARVQQTVGAPVLAEPTLWQVFATAGFAGGFVYWLLAGRNA